MKDESTRILNAAAGGQQVMDDNAAIWNGKPAIVIKKNALDTKIAEIGALDDNETDGTGEGTAKTAARKTAATTAWQLAKPLRVYAKDINDTVLEHEIDFEWYDLRYGKEQDALDDWQLIHDRADTHQAALGAGGYVDVALIPQLLLDINAFKAKRGKPKAKRSDNKAINKQIALKIKELQVIKEDLLGLLVQFAVSNAQFYSAVKSAFEKDMIGIRHLALRVRYTDEVTGIRLAGVEGEIKELAKKKLSSRKGVIEYSLQELPQGNYKYLSKLKTYKDDSKENVGVQEGKLLTLDIKMVKGEGSGGGGTTTGTINGNVKQGGMPYKGANISVEGQPTLMATTDANGNFTIANVPAGKQKVMAQLPVSPMPPQMQEVMVVAGGDVNLGFNF